MRSDLPEAAAVREQITAASQSDDADDLVVGPIRELAGSLSKYPSDHAGFGSDEFPDQVIREPETDAELTWYAQSYWFTHGDGVMRERLKTSGPRLPTDGRAPDELVDRMMSSPALQQIVQACAVLCPATQRSCVRAAHSFSSGYLGLFDLGSPAETLIPQERYVRSARARDELLQHIGSPYGHPRFEPSDARVDAVAEQSPCLADHVRPVARWLESEYK